ncbi:MAG: acyl-CoA dehydrogenase [Betaproteobacteria bacterium]|nr:acyl-CoA dehydrogenase [Betaproteobacteria bacterium]
MHVAGLAATLERDDVRAEIGADLPPLWHWMFLAPIARQSDIGPDGHPKRGGFLPPVPLPRRMWAGGRLRFHEPLRVGDEIRRESRVAAVDMKSGSTGTLVFVRVEHAIGTDRGIALTEEHDIVYRDHPTPDAPAPSPRAAPGDAAFSREVCADPVMLFRYSALTFNGHRIHYDRSYVTEVEGYPGLVVHGPLIATLLVDLLARNLPDARVSGFSFRAVRPTFDIHRFSVCGRPDADGRIALWGRDHEGWLTMDASATLA